MEITQKTLTRKYGKEKGEELFAEVALRGGFGRVGTMENELSETVALDIDGVLDPDNKAVDESDKKRIREIISGGKDEKAEIKKAEDAK